MLRRLRTAIVLLAALSISACGKGQARTQPSPQGRQAPAGAQSREGPKPYEQVIMRTAKSDSGLFVVH